MHLSEVTILKGIIKSLWLNYFIKTLQITPGSPKGKLPFMFWELSKVLHHSATHVKLDNKISQTTF